jgi:hypothetical protein
MGQALRVPGTRRNHDSPREMVCQELGGDRRSQGDGDTDGCVASWRASWLWPLVQGPVASWGRWLHPYHHLAPERGPEIDVDAVSVPFCIGDCGSTISGIGPPNPGSSRSGVGSCGRPFSCAHAIQARCSGCTPPAAPRQSSGAADPAQDGPPWWYCPRLESPPRMLDRGRWFPLGPPRRAKESAEDSCAQTLT